MSTTLAERMGKFSGSPTSAIIARVAELKREGRDIISLNVGEPDFPTPANIKMAGVKAIADDFTRYTPGSGVLELREQIARKLREENGIEYTPAEITVAVGAKQALASVMMVIAGPGDEVLLPVPCWVSYTEMIRLAGAEPVFVDVRLDNFELDIAAIERAITPRTKAIIVCSPNNPTGAVYGEADLRALADLAERHDFFIVADEIYEKLIYDGAKHFSVASISRSVRDRTITINGFSKAYAMTGWRLGYAAARADVIKGVVSVQSQTTSSPCSVAQIAGVEALAGPQSDMLMMVGEFERRRNFIVKALRDMPGVKCADVRGAFYVFPDMSSFVGKASGKWKIDSTKTLCEYLLDEALVSTVPGEAFNMEGHVRMSYANSMANLEEAMRRTAGALAALK